MEVCASLQITPPGAHGDSDWQHLRPHSSSSRPVGSSVEDLGERRPLPGGAGAGGLAWLPGVPTGRGGGVGRRRSVGDAGAAIASAATPWMPSIWSMRSSSAAWRLFACSSCGPMLAVSTCAPGRGLSHSHIPHSELDRFVPAVAPTASVPRAGSAGWPAWCPGYTVHDQIPEEAPRSKMRLRTHPWPRCASALSGESAPSESPLEGDPE